MAPVQCVMHCTCVASIYFCMFIYLYVFIFIIAYTYTCMYTCYHIIYMYMYMYMHHNCIPPSRGRGVCLGHQQHGPVWAGPQQRLHHLAGPRPGPAGSPGAADLGWHLAQHRVDRRPRRQVGGRGQMVN